MTKYQAQWLRGMSRIPQTDVYYIPMWHKPVYLSEDINENEKVLRIDKTLTYNLLDCDWIEIFRKDDHLQDANNNLIRQVYNFTDGEIRLHKKLPRKLLVANTFIYPLMRVSTSVEDSITYMFSNGTSESFVFEQVPTIPKHSIPLDYIYYYDTWIPNYNPFGLPETYKGKQVLLKPPSWVDDSSLTLGITKNTYRLDNSSGIFAYDLKNKCFYDTHTAQFNLISNYEINNMIKFYRGICGRFKSFFFPSWVNDFQVDLDIIGGTNYIYTSYNKLYTFYQKSTRHKAIAVFFKDMTSVVSDVLSFTYEKIGETDYGKIIIADNFSRTYKSDEILMVCYFNLVRSDSDTLELDYESNTCAYATLVFREVDDLE